MLQYFYNLIPEKIKACLDVAAACAAVFSLPVVEIFSGLMAGLASFAAFTYTIIRIHFFLKEKRSKK